jgi:DNA topoisomerase-1
MERKSLVIVESPSKAKTINKFLGKNYKVEASVGHIIDLPKSKLGVSIEQGFKPQYIKIRGKEKIIKHLKSAAAKADKIYLATDPDREGEAIAYHIASILDRDKKDVKRVEFNEITKQAINLAFEMPREIDMARVYSQQARRVLDRIVGYQVSPILWKTIYRGLSAGRVQSVALRLICEREESIRQFVAEEYWTIKILVRGKPEAPFWAKLIKIKPDADKEAVPVSIKNETEAADHVQRIKQANLVILELDTRRVKKTPPPPFITSTMQQAAARLLRFSTSRIMRIAQQLYEGVEIPGQDSVGLITYMRTDSTRISSEAIHSVRQLIQQDFGKEYLPEHARHYRSKKSAQDAHEAIRPTYLGTDFNPLKLKKHLSAEQFKLYDLIWKRFLACQMQEALFDKTMVDIGGNEYLFRAEGETMVFDGFLKVYGTSLEKENGDDNDAVTIPAGLHKHEPLRLQDIDSKQNFTKAPPRFMESSLVKELDRLGIGRPSTYAQIIYTILARKYVEKKENKLWATELGETVNKILINNFPDIFDVSFTAEMEDELDKIAAHKLKYEEVMHNFYQPFTVSLQKVHTQREQIKSELQEETSTICDLCGKPMIIRWGRNGRFMACSGYPECKNTKPLNGEDEPKTSDEICEKCGNPMVYKVGRYGRFLACSNYPACKNTKAIPLGIKCPKPGCGGDIIQRRSKKGKIFYGCSRYPNCDFVSWDKPVNRACSNCGHSYLLEKYNKAQGNFLTCPECKTSSILIKNGA